MRYLRLSPLAVNFLTSLRYLTLYSSNGSVSQLNLGAQNEGYWSMNVDNNIPSRCGIYLCVAMRRYAVTQLRNIKVVKALLITIAWSFRP